MMDINEIREYLPHRYPFLLVDRVVELDVEGKRIRAYKNVSINEPFFNGHFPAHPIMPGVLIIEAMAQAAGILGFKMLDVKPADGTLYYFVGSDKLRFRQPVAARRSVDPRSQVPELQASDLEVRVPGFGRWQASLLC